ncbi:TorF family putative porin [Methylobacterium pseudosasicola]|uniref:MetA-pathway of phenol degradation n=1 Tax=Methylobacterium pseudosasicola TaxID=582667 RepID=A0A1I4GWY6_9HYPH|nr:TorF family putative porin [Methylobacterium pseudosasicola]SFL34050.1 conserved hypothetical protein [Methylobacterium pseudosasicola]
MSARPVCLAVLLTSMLPGLGRAADAPPSAPIVDPQAVSASFGFRAVTDYNSRGISQTNHHPGVQGYLELQMLDGFAYVGIAGESLTLPNRPFMEMDFSGGIRPTFGAWTFDLGYLFYNYPNERALIGPDGTIYTANNADYYEFAGKAAYAVNDALTLGVNVYTSPSYFGTHAPGTYVAGIMKYAVPEGTFGVLPSGVLISSEVGHYFLGTTNASFGRFRLPDYSYGNVGIAYTAKNITLDLRFHDTTMTRSQCGTITADPRSIFNGTFRSNWCGAAFVATLSFDATSKDPGVFAKEDTVAPSVPARTSDAEGPAVP